MSFKNIDVQTLPEGWHARFFADLADFRMGKTPPRNRDEYWDNGVYPWVSIADMEPFGIVTDTKEKVSEHAHQQVFRRALVPSGSLLMSFKLTIGRLAKLGIPAYHNEAIISFRPAGEEVDTDFLFYYLAQINYQDYQDTAVKGKTLNKSKMEKLEIALPPLPEQRKIAAVLGLVRRAIEQQERLLALTTELKKTLLHKLFTEGLRGEPQKQTEIGLVPEGWVVTALVNVALAFDYGTSVKCEHGKAGSPVLRIPNVVGGSIDLGDIKHGQPKRTEIEALRLRDGDLLFVRTNGVLENAGRCALYRGELEGCYFASYLIRVRADCSKLLPAFVNEYARTERGRSFLSGRAIRTADGKFNINSGTLKRVLLPLPSLDEQNEIVRQLDIVARKLKLLDAKRSALNDLFRTLLHQLMTAQIRVHDLELPELN